MAAKKTQSKKTISSNGSSRKRSPSSSNGSSKKSSSTKKTARKSGGRSPDALKMLRDDHERVQGMFESYEKLRTKRQKEKLAGEICEELTVHATLEEEIFYPAVREAIDDDDLMDEATVEHQTAKDLIHFLQNHSPEDELYDAKVKVLGEYIKHHVEEEHDEMFPKVRKSDLDLADLGNRMREHKEALLSQLA